MVNRQGSPQETDSSYLGAAATSWQMARPKKKGVGFFLRGERVRLIAAGPEEREKTIIPHRRLPIK